MSGPVVLPAAGGELRIGVDGGVAGVGWQGRDYLRCWTPRTATVAGVTSDWVLTHRTEDETECEVSYAWRADRSLRLEIRHAVAPVWSERWALSLDPDRVGTEPIDIDALTAELDLAAGMAGRIGVAGTQTWFALVPPEGVGPVFGARLQTGAVVAVSGSRLSCGPVRLTPGRRYVVGWQAAWYDTPWAFQRQLGDNLPGVEAFTVGEVWDLPTDPDRVVLCPPELSVTTGERSTEITAYVPGRYPVELRSARGTVRTEVSWAPTLIEAVGRRAAAVLAGADRTRAGTPRLDAAAAVLVQYALAAVLVDDRDTAAEALELFTGELVAGSGRIVTPTDPFALVVAAREVIRGGDPMVLDVLDDLRPPTDDTPGAGLAAAQVALAAVVTGRRPQPPSPRGPDAERVVLSPGTVDPDVLLGTIRALGAGLGGGLAGTDLRPAAVGDPDAVAVAAEAAYRVALLGMVPEALAPALVREWGCSVPMLAERARSALLARPDLPLTALAWLCVAEPQR